jgi:hypothetical protein
MNSPFPGMDPYIEACGLWEDFHDTLVIGIRSTLARTVPDRYLVRSGERAYIVLEPGEPHTGTYEHRAQSDVAVLVEEKASASSAATAVLPETEAEDSPITMRAITGTEYHEAFVEIRTADPQQQLVTTIEVLSPSNKRFGSPGWQQYQRKRYAHLLGLANFVEIDLLRGGRRMPMEGSWPDAPYYFLSCRKKDAPSCNVWTAHFVQPLPPISVPLLEPDPDVTFDIQSLVNGIYVESKYHRQIDYDAPCKPPLSKDDNKWLQNRLRSVGQGSP